MKANKQRLMNIAKGIDNDAGGIYHLDIENGKVVLYGFSPLEDDLKVFVVCYAPPCDNDLYDVLYSEAKKPENLKQLLLEYQSKKAEK